MVLSNPSNELPDRLRVLSVYRARNAENLPAPFISSQLDSLNKSGIEIHPFPISGNNLLSYFSGSRGMRKLIHDIDIDLIHAHYSLCALSAVLARTGKPIVLSLMGSDVLGEFVSPERVSFRSHIVSILTKLTLPFTTSLIVKSENIYQNVSTHKSVYLIPNGINLVKFKPIDKTIARKQLGLDLSKKIVLFLSNPEHKWKNAALAKAAVELLDDPEVQLLTPFPVSHEKVVVFLNAADVMISTSFMEGSSNVIKEAMACSTPVVATDVGDTARVINSVEGCYLIGFEPDDAATKLKSAVAFALKSGKTKGRERIIELGLDSESTAKKIMEVYLNTLNQT